MDKDPYAEGADAYLAGQPEMANPYDPEDDCSDCPPLGYPTDKTRCDECPRRLHPTTPGKENNERTSS